MKSVAESARLVCLKSKDDGVEHFVGCRIIIIIAITIITNSQLSAAMALEKSAIIISLLCSTSAVLWHPALQVYGFVTPTQSHRRNSVWSWHDSRPQKGTGVRWCWVERTTTSAHLNHTTTS